MMESKTWIAIALSLAVWFVYMKWFGPQPQPQAPGQVQTGQTSTATQASQPGTSTPPATGTTTTANADVSGPFNLAFPKAELQTRQNGKIEVGFSPVGGKVAEVKVLTYRETIKANSNYVTPIRPDHDAIALSTLFTDPALSTFSNGTYKLDNSQNDAIRYTRSEKGVSLTKDYKVDPSGYFIESSFTLKLPKESRRDWGHLFIPVGGNNYQYDASDPIKSWEVVAYQDEKVKRKNLSDIALPEEVSQGNTKWLAFGNRYFASVLISDSGINPDVIYTKQSGFMGAYLRYPLVPRQDGSDLRFKLKYYVGPKDVDDLSKIPGMKKLVDFGMFAVFAYPLLAIMRFFYSIIHNWGIAIILLTILVRLIFYPLSVKSYRSMKSMQKLQPQIKALREKYKDDMQRFNQEQMALFKAHKVNPMGGCLPILVQIPVFFALYAVLSNSIDLFHAPFFGWVMDLSAKDPFYVFPILMGASMFIQQKMTPTAGMDPMQAKMMLFMPIVFTFIMLNLPSGLTVYIFLSTLLGIPQQMAINREPSTSSAKVSVVQSEGTK